MSETVSILGTPYTVYLKVDHDSDPLLENAYGYTLSPLRKIVIADSRTCPWFKNEPPEQDEHVEKVTLRHEIIHAFLRESGLDESSNGYAHWAVNEEMVDWIAYQWPKIQAVYQQLGCEGW